MKKGVNSRDISWRFVRVWYRDFVVYRRIWKMNFIVPLLEPAFYILAFGLGFSQLIGGIPYAGPQLTYIEFMAPPLVATAGMINQNSFVGILATPLSLQEFILADSAWSGTKSAGAVAIMLAVLMPLGYVNFPQGLLIIPVAFLGGLAFGAIGMFFTGIIPTIDMFNLPVFLFITPMFLFSGTFFPVSGLPAWARPLSLAFPLFQQVEITRRLSLGYSESNPWFNLLYLTVFFLVFTYLGLWGMKRRLIK